MSGKFLIKGDITRSVKVQAIVTLINSGGMWYGGVDGAIERVAGEMYHSQARNTKRSKGLKNEQVVVAKGKSSNHEGSFDDVVFVVDDLESPLGTLVHIALMAAKNEGYESVALPLMRSGVMAGVVEKTMKAVVAEMRKGIEQAVADGADMDIYVVVYEEPEAVKMLSDSMNLLEQ